MVYSQLYFKDKLKIPTFSVFLILLLLIIFFAQFFHRSAFPSKAEKKTLRRIEITNISPNQVTVVWQTNSKSISWLVYGESPKNLISIALDERDLEYKKTPYLNHYAILRNLKEGKKYFFAIVADNQLIKDAENQPFSFSTPSGQSISKTSQPAYGKILKPNNLPLENAIVFLNFPNAYLLSAITKSTGEWLIPLNVVYDKETLTPKIPSPQEKVIIEIISEDNLVTTVETNLSKISPLPQTLIIGKNYNFLTEGNVLSATNEKIITSLSKKEIDIIYPQEGALIPGFTPIIKGLGNPDIPVLITLFAGNKTYSSKVVANKDGAWSLVFSERLPIGKHKIMITTQDKKGEKITLERNFFIVANEGNAARVLGEATPESTLISPSPTRRPTFQPTPTVFITSPTATIIPTTPVSGENNILPLIFGSISFIILGLGLILVF